MTAATGLAQRTPLRDDAIVKAELVGTDLLERLVAALKESVAIDMVALAHVEDDIDSVLGDCAPAADHVTQLSLRLRSALAQLVDLGMPAVRNEPEGELAIAVLRACEALKELLPAQGDESLGHLRRVALAAQNILDQDLIDEETLDHVAFLAGEAT
ncbi:DUF6415 family natural product biosynthesis protein [[Kitasatospora] papulosa]|uniref:DUF6415 family natural product biosynthesis protein n=1 Tax=Streptomyces TaxID=1883 RepID=UPI0033244A33